MEEQNIIPTAVEAPAVAVEAKPKKRATRSRKKVVAPAETPENTTEETPAEPVTTTVAEAGDTPAVTNPEPKPEPAEAPKAEAKEAPKAEAKEAPKAEAKAETQPEPKQEAKPEPKSEPRQPKVKPLPNMPRGLVIRDFCDLANQGSRLPMLNDQQIQQLTMEEAQQRNLILEAILCNVLDYDIVMSDTNIWLELLVGHTSSHSDPRVNARLAFERQLEFISRMMKRIGGKFMIMSETYEEVDRFATQQEPTDYKVADWKDEALCRNVAARLAKRLMLAQQKENRLRIEGIGSESHHAAFADPAIIRRTVELFAEGKKVLLLTNDASVGIRSLGMCDDLQRHNKISDEVWREVYEPQRPMVLTMDDLKLLDQYTRQYHFLMVAAGRQWMQDVTMRKPAHVEKPLELWMEGFRPGDRHERRSERQERERQEQEKRERAEQQRQEQQRREEEKRAERERQEQEKRERAEQQRQEQQRREEEKRARREEQQRREEEKRARRQAAQAAQAAVVPAPVDEAPNAEASNTEAPQQNTEVKANATAPEANVAAPVANVAAPEADTAPAEANATAAEAGAAAPEGEIAIPSLTPEMAELMGPTSGEKKGRTRRGSRRRSTAKNKEAKE